MKSIPTEEQEKEKKLSEDSLDFVWDILQKYLDFGESNIDSNNNLSSVMSASILPLLQAYFCFNLGFQKEKSDSEEIILSPRNVPKENVSKKI